MQTMTQASNGRGKGDIEWVSSEAELISSLEQIIDSYSGQRGILIPVLQETQTRLGYLPEPALRQISKRLKIPYSEVTGVVSFYSFFTTVPRGKHIVRVCLGTACYVRGGKEVLAAAERALGIGVGQTTKNRLFSLETGRCFGACGLAPVLLVDEDVHQRVKPARMKDILAPYALQEDV